MNVVCVVMPHRFVSRYQYFGGTLVPSSGLKLRPENEERMFLPNVGIYTQVYTASPLGSRPPTASPPSEAQSHVTTHSNAANPFVVPLQWYCTALHPIKVDSHLTTQTRPDNDTAEKLSHSHVTTRHVNDTTTDVTVLQNVLPDRDCFTNCLSSRILVGLNGKKIQLKYLS
jgi:hypothetical protein